MGGNMGIKEALEQYCDTQQEIKDIKSRIETLERQIAVMEKQGYTQQASFFVAPVQFLILGKKIPAIKY